MDDAAARPQEVDLNNERWDACGAARDRYAARVRARPRRRRPRRRGRTPRVGGRAGRARRGPGRAQLGDRAAVVRPPAERELPGEGDRGLPRGRHGARVLHAAVGRRGRPGMHYINTHDIPGKRCTRSPPSYHEANPGHHFQIALEMEFDERPALRRFGLSGGVVRGGLGSLQRAARGRHGAVRGRLGAARDAGRAGAPRRPPIADTGLHAFGWTRERAIEKLVAGGSPRGESEVEVDRYIALPAQAQAYMIGMIEIEDARRRTQEQEGPRSTCRPSTTGCSRWVSCRCRRCGASSPRRARAQQQVVEHPALPEDVGLGEHRAGRERQRAAAGCVPSSRRSARRGARARWRGRPRPPSRRPRTRRPRPARRWSADAAAPVESPQTRSIATAAAASRTLREPLGGDVRHRACRRDGGRGRPRGRSARATGNGTPPPR